MTVPQAARRLGVSRATAFRWARAGVLPAQRVGKLLLVTREDVEGLRPRVLSKPHVGRLLPAEPVRPRRR